jgi:hypothetical protein
MRTFCLTTTIALFVLCFTTGTQAQTTQTKLDQVELMKQLLGNWQANKVVDTILLFEYKQIGQAYLANTYHIINGQKTLSWINNFGFDVKVQKPEALTAFGRSYYNNNIYLVIKDLTPVIDGQLILAESGRG